MDIKKLMKLGKYDYYAVHLSIINCLLPKKMTPMEINVLSVFMGLEGDIAEYRFDISARKIVRGELGISSASLCNYIASLETKGFISKKKGVRNILPILVPDKNNQRYLIKLDRNDDIPSGLAVRKTKKK